MPQVILDIDGSLHYYTIDPKLDLLHIGDDIYKKFINGSGPYTHYNFYDTRGMQYVSTEQFRDNDIVLFRQNYQIHRMIDNLSVKKLLSEWGLNTADVLIPECKDGFWIRISDDVVLCNDSEYTDPIVREDAIIYDRYDRTIISLSRDGNGFVVKCMNDGIFQWEGNYKKK